MPVAQEMVDGSFFVSGPPQTLDPLMAFTRGETEVASMLFDGLTQATSVDGVTSLKPAVAESWEMSDDAMTFTFVLREGLAFSNGEPVLPSSFKRGWEIAADPERASPFAHLLSIVVGYVALEAGRTKSLEGVEADDNTMTLRVRLSEPYADLAARVSHVAFSPMPEARTDLEADGSWGATEMPGNGPFVVALPVGDRQVVMTRRENSNDGVGLSRIAFRVFDDTAGARAAFDNGEVDTSPARDADDWTSTMGNQPTTSRLELTSWVFGMGEQSPVGGGERVLLRRAISAVIDRQAIVDEVFAGNGVAAESVTPPGVLDYEQVACSACLGQAAARALLDDYRAGGGDVPDDVALVYDQASLVDARTAELIADALEEIGLSGDLQGLPSDKFAESMAGGLCPGICPAGWIWDEPTYDNGLFESFSSSGLGSTNVAGYSSSYFDASMADARALAEPAARAEAFRDLERRVVELDAVVVPLVWAVDATLVASRVNGFAPDALGLVAFELISVSAPAQRAVSLPVL